MTEKLKSQYHQLERSREKLFNSLASYSDEVLNKKPAPEKWSVAGVIQHLMNSEEASLRYLQKKTQDLSKAPKAGWRGTYRLLLIKAVFTVPMKFKSPEALEPAEGFVSLQELKTKWSATRRATFQLLEKLPNDDLNKEVWKHIVSGKMNASQMYDFFQFHFNRHRGQIERTLDAVK